MMTNVVNSVPYLRTSRNFPEEPHMLTVEVNKTYVDIANAVNNRTISIFPTLRPAVNGESWFLFKNQRQQAFRQAYTFTSTGNISHGINFNSIYGFVRIFGSFTNGTNWYPLPYVDVVNVTNQVNVIVTPSNIVISSGAGAPVIVSGTIVLEWLSQP